MLDNSNAIDAAEESKLRRLGFVNANRHAVDLVARYAIKGMLNEGEVSLVHGDGNVGKTAFVCALGAHICRGERFAGRRVTRGMVLHNAAEAPQSVIRRAGPLLADALDAAPYLVLERRTDLGCQEDVAGFIDRARRAEDAAGEKLRLVIFDTANLSMGERDENSTRDVSDVIEGAKSTARFLRVHVIIVHHSGKAGDGKARGSSVFRDNADAAFGLRSEERDGGPCTVVTNNKQRDDSRSSPIAFRIEAHLLGHDQDGDPVTTPVARFIDAAGLGATGDRPASRETASSRRAPAVIAALATLQATGDAAGDGFAVADIRRACDMTTFAECGTDPSRDKAVERVLEVLAKNPAAGVNEMGRKRFMLAAPRPAPVAP